MKVPFYLFFFNVFNAIESLVMFILRKTGLLFIAHIIEKTLQNIYDFSVNSSVWTINEIIDLIEWSYRAFEKYLNFHFSRFFLNPYLSSYITLTNLIDYNVQQDFGLYRDETFLLQPLYYQFTYLFDFKFYTHIILEVDLFQTIYHQIIIDYYYIELSSIGIQLILNVINSTYMTRGLYLKYRAQYQWNNYRTKSNNYIKVFTIDSS